MFVVFVEIAIVIIVVAWVVARALVAVGRWSDDHPVGRNSKLARDAQIRPTKRRFEDLDFGVLGVICAFGLIFVLVATGAVHIGGHSISPKEIPDSVRAGTEFDTVATFVQAWETEEPLQFCAFLGTLLVAVIWLVRRSPWLVGIALVVAGFILGLRMKT